LDSKNIEAKLSKYDTECARIEAQIKNYDNQLIQKIADNEDTRKILNTIFSADFRGIAG
jgi:hypothetical protein